MSQHPTAALQLPHALAQRITDFLQSLPNILERSMRQTLVMNATLDARLEAQIDIDAPPAQFVSKLIAVLLRYGQLEDQRHALSAVLASARQYIGPNRQSECDALIRAIEQRIQPPQIEPEISPLLMRIVTQPPVRIFLSYTRADHATVKVLYDHLQEAGLVPWMDTEDLLPGQRFEREIRKAIRSADFFLACLSKQAVDRRGFIQREIGEALDILQEKLDDDIFVIPVRLEECDVPERLREFHWADLYRSNGLPKLLQAIRTQCLNRSSGAEQTPMLVTKVREPQIGDTCTEPTTGMEFVWIAPGQFMMGATDDEHQFLRKQKWWDEHFKSELPRHSVTIKQGFWLGKYPVTQAQWEHVMGNNPSRFKGANNPVEQVSWDDCQEFLKTLNQLTPHPLSLEKRGGQAGELIPPSFFQREGAGGEFFFRLSTEAEWEYACRAGTDTIWHFGNDASQLKNYAWHAENSGKQTHPVGQLQPNAWGLCDMLGNVWEWCADTWHDSYAGAPSDGSAWERLEEEKAKMLRGGSWFYDPRLCRCAYRGWDSRGFRHFDLGLRVVCRGVGRTL